MLMQARDINGKIFDVDTDRAYIPEVQNIYPKKILSAGNRQVICFVDDGAR